MLGNAPTVPLPPGGAMLISLDVLMPPPSQVGHNTCCFPSTFTVQILHVLFAAAAQNGQPHERTELVQQEATRKLWAL